MVTINSSAFFHWYSNLCENKITITEKSGSTSHKIDHEKHTFRHYLQILLRISLCFRKIEKHQYKYPNIKRIGNAIRNVWFSVDIHHILQIFIGIVFNIWVYVVCMKSRKRWCLYLLLRLRRSKFPWFISQKIGAGDCILEKLICSLIVSRTKNESR